MPVFIGFKAYLMRILSVYKAKKALGLPALVSVMHLFGMAGCLSLNCVSPRLLARKARRLVGNALTIANAPKPCLGGFPPTACCILCNDCYGRELQHIVNIANRMEVSDGQSRGTGGV